MAVRAFMFDAYGTLFDVHAAIREAGAALGADADLVSQRWRTKQLEYTWTRTMMGRVLDFWTLTGHALDHALASVGASDPALRERLLEAYHRLSAFSDVRPALDGLKGLGMATAIFTNGTEEMVKAAIVAASIDDVVDHVITVGPTGVYKPMMTVYDHALQVMGGIERSEIVFVSSNRWDVAAAAVFGFIPVWCNRTGAPQEYVDALPAATIPNLTGLTALRLG